MKFLILAGGTGKRLKSKKSKPLTKLNNKPLIKYILDIINNLNKNSKKIIIANPKNYNDLENMADKNTRIYIQEKPLGTAHAAKIGIDHIDENEDVFILYSDTPLFRDSTLYAMYEHHRLTKSDITFMSGLTNIQYPYAVVYRDENGKVIELEEHGTPQYNPPYEYSIGAYIMKAGIFKKLFSEIKPHPETHEYYIPELIIKAIEKNLTVEGYICLDEDEYLGINTYEDLKLAKEILLKREVSDSQIQEEKHIKFGTGGWRAHIGRGFTLQNVKKLTQAISNYLKIQGKANNPVIIGFDNRFLSDEAAKEISCVLSANNIKNYISTAPIPTPLVTFTVLEKKGALGMVVTASHNPYNYNGIKVETEDGLPIPLYMSEEIEKLANKIEKISWIPYSVAKEKNFTKECDFRRKYLDYLENKLDYTEIKNTGLKICFDSMYGSGTTTIQLALIGARCDLKIIRGYRDTLFEGSSPAPTEERLSHLIYEMKNGNFDVGMAVDGDADRIVLVDEKGNFLHTNEVISLLWYYMHEIKGFKGGVVRNVGTSHNIDRLCESFNEKTYEVPVGFKYIAEGIKKYNALVGGESSGGITFIDHIMEKDGVYAAMLVVEMLAKTGEKISTILEKIKSIVGEWMLYFEKNYDILPKTKINLNKFFSEEHKTIAGYNVIEKRTIDGHKYILEGGRWVLLRPSGTEPLIRIIGEAKNKNEIEKILNFLIKKLEL